MQAIGGDREASRVRAKRLQRHVFQSPALWSLSAQELSYRVGQNFGASQVSRDWRPIFPKLRLSRSACRCRAQRVLRESHLSWPARLCPSAWGSSPAPSSSSTSCCNNSLQRLRFAQQAHPAPGCTSWRCVFIAPTQDFLPARQSCRRWRASSSTFAAKSSGVIVTPSL